MSVKFSLLKILCSMKCRRLWPIFFSGFIRLTRECKLKLHLRISAIPVLKFEFRFIMGSSSLDELAPSIDLRIGSETPTSIEISPVFLSSSKLRMKKSKTLLRNPSSFPTSKIRFFNSYPFRSESYSQFCSSDFCSSSFRR